MCIFIYIYIYTERERDCERASSSCNGRANMFLTQDRTHVRSTVCMYGIAMSKYIFIKDLYIYTQWSAATFKGSDSVGSLLSICGSRKRCAGPALCVGFRSSARTLLLHGSWSSRPSSSCAADMSSLGQGPFRKVVCGGFALSAAHHIDVI